MSTFFQGIAGTYGQLGTGSATTGLHFLAKGVQAYVEQLVCSFEGGLIEVSAAVVGMTCVATCRS